MGNIANKLVKAESLATALEEANTQIASLEGHLKTSDAQVQQTVEAKSVAELEAEKHKAESQRLESTLKEFEDGLASKEALLAKAKKEIDERWEGLYAEVKKVQREAREWLLKFWKRQKSSYQCQGAFKSRLDFLTSPVGQEFLRIMHRDLLTEYTQTTEFARAAGKGFGILMGEAIEGACQQMRVIPEQRDKLDSKRILAQMDLARVNAGLGVVPGKPANWWNPVMEKAAQVMIERGENDPDLSKWRLYELSYLDTLTASRLKEIGRTRVDSAGSDLSEGALRAINEICGPKEIPEEGTADPKEQTEVTSVIRVDAHPSGQDDAQAGPN